jgi:hypothetical protein
MIEEIARDGSKIIVAFDEENAIAKKNDIAIACNGGQAVAYEGWRAVAKNGGQIVGITNKNK